MPNKRIPEPKPAKELPISGFRFQPSLFPLAAAGSQA
jgi:hypothetical protein